MKKLILIALFIFITPVFSSAESGERLTIDGYNLSISATKLSSGLVVRCQIKGGKSTDRLSINMDLVDNNGKTVNVKYACNNYNSSDKFSIKKSISSGGNRWKVSWIDISN